MSQNLSASLKISLSYQAVYQYLLDNLVSGPSFVPTVIAALHPSNMGDYLNVQWRDIGETEDGIASTDSTRRERSVSQLCC